MGYVVSVAVVVIVVIVVVVVNAPRPPPSKGSVLTRSLENRGGRFGGNGRVDFQIFKAMFWNEALTIEAAVSEETAASMSKLSRLRSGTKP